MPYPSCFKPFFKDVYIHAIKAIVIPIVFTEFPTGNTDDNILVETKNTIPYIMSPTLL
jgi:hypothetical protein